MRPGYSSASDCRLFRSLRARVPVYRHPERDGPGFWAVARHADLSHCGRHPELYSSAKGVLLPEVPASRRAGANHALMTMDPPRHRTYRHTIQRGFTPKRTAKLAGRVRKSVTAILDEVEPAGQCDFAQSVAGELALRVIADVVGIPAIDRPRIAAWVTRLLADAGQPNLGRDSQLAAAEIWLYARDLVALRRREPGDDMVSSLLDANVNGRPLKETEFNGLFLHVLTAGIETVRDAASNGLMALLEHPEQLERLRADPSLCPSAVEEILRYSPSVIYMRRTVVSDTELGGKALRAGDKVALYYPSACRDEAVFPEPDRFDVGRSPNPHLAFGFGEHFCLGASLARLELRMLFEELLERWQEIHLTGPVKRSASTFVAGIESLPVRFRESLEAHHNPVAA